MGKRTDTHAFFRGHSSAVETRQDHDHTVVTALECSGWSVNVISSPVEVNEGLFTLQH